MLANFLHLFTRRASGDDYERAFVEEVRVVVPREPSSRRSEWIIAGGWVLIGLKCWGVCWIVQKCQVPFSAWWINGPSLAAATLVTYVYLRRP